MKNNNKLSLKILAGIVSVVLIGGMLFITNSFVGNPISAMMADKAIKEYVNQNYSSLDLEVEKAKFNFEVTGYMANVKSKTSIDTRFAIYYVGGMVQRDDYENYVLGLYNTLDRFSTEYSAIAKNIVEKELGYEDNMTNVLYDIDNYENNNDVLELDMKFDKALPLSPEVTIQLDITDYSIESVAKVLTDAHKAFVDNGCIFYKYGFYDEDKEKSIMVIGVTAADIENKNFIDLLKKADKEKNNTATEEGIAIFRK